MRLAAVNSINWARVMAQVVYYVTTARALAGPVTACVPTGNFGNVFAGWIARRMGAPIADFVVASNANDILTRFVNDDDMSIAAVVPTLSPSMDIQVSSNFERMLWVMNDGNGPRTGEQLQRFREHRPAGGRRGARARWINGAFRAASVERRRGRSTRSGGSTPRPACSSTRTPRPARWRHGGARGEHPVVTMATAHPAKFPDAVERATGVRPQLPPTSPTCSTGPSASRSSPTTSPSSRTW